MLQLLHNILLQVSPIFMKWYFRALMEITASLPAHMLFFLQCCRSAVELNISSITPLAQNLTLNGAPVPNKYLFRPLMKIWGGKVRNLDGSEAPQEYDQNQQKLNYVSKYVLLPLNTTAESVLTYGFDEDLDEGYYKVNVVMSVLTEYPKLVALNGLTAINQSDASGENVQGMYEALAFQVTNGSEVGVQYSPTRLSEIKGSSPDRTIKVSPFMCMPRVFCML
jgi:hypothetical protein